MPELFYHASHEQFAPSALLDLAARAEDAGFDGVFSSDHLQPWLPSQGESGFLWAWLGSALARTARVGFAGITVPGGARFHPVVVAQALATLTEMFPGRLPWFAFGSGEALNETPLGMPWKPKAERQSRLRSAFDTVRKLLAGETVDKPGPLAARSARIWSLPARPPLLFGAALSPETARWMGPWVDGLLTAGVDPDRVGQVLAAFRDGGGRGKPVHLKVDLCLGATNSAALAEAHREWRCASLPPEVLADLPTPSGFLDAARDISLEEVSRTVIAAGEATTFVDRLRALIDLGIDALDLHHVGQNQAGFIDVFGREVLPHLRQPSGTTAMPTGESTLPASTPHDDGESFSSGS